MVFWQYGIKVSSLLLDDTGWLTDERRYENKANNIIFYYKHLEDFLKRFEGLYFSWDVLSKAAEN